MLSIEHSGGAFPTDQRLELMWDMVLDWFANCAGTIAVNPDFRSRLPARYGEAPPVIGGAHLIRNKRASARPQDLIDLDLLERFDS